MAYPSQDADRINFRVPDGLRERLKEAGAANGRSMNAEIVARLEASFDAPRVLDPEIARLLEAYVARRVAERLSEVARTLGAK
jgi:plasmid stability protein